MRKHKLALGAIIILLPVLLILLFQLFQSISVKISREQAITIAQRTCASVHSQPKQGPSNIKANLMTEKTTQSRLHGQRTDSPNKLVWLISMDGIWEHEPPPAGPHQTSVPLQFRHCNVIIDANTGITETVTN